MLRKILSATIAASVALSPLAATAQEYRFRYVHGMTNINPPAEEEPEIGIGNDIEAHFVSVVGIEFGKEIPVATKDVRLWKVDEGTLPEGISLNTSTGYVSGIAANVEKTETLLRGFDISGNQIAKARIFFNTVKPEGVGLTASWYGHTGQYLYQTLPTPDGVEIPKWEIIDTGAPSPEGMATAYGAYEGTPAKEGDHKIIFQGYDYLDRKVAYVDATLLVQDGPVIEEISSQIVDKSAGRKFNVLPVVKHSIGTITYKLVPVDERPEGVEFNSATGRVGGVFDEFETTAEFQIEARDSADGTTGRSNKFTLGTMPARISIPYLQSVGLTATLGKPYKRALQPNRDDIDIKFEIVGGRLPSGITMNEQGEFSGTPDVLETQMVTLRISGDGATPTDILFEFRVRAVNLVVDANSFHTRINTPFETDPITVRTGLVDPMTYESTPTVPEITFDAEKKNFSSPGFATPGGRNQVVTVTNGANDSFSRTQYIRIWSDVNLTYPANTDVVRNEYATIRPTLDYDALRGDYSFKLEQGTLPDWLKFSSGRFISSLKDLSDVTGAPAGPFVVSVTDAFGVPVRSEPFTITAVDRKPIKLSENNLEFQYGISQWVRPVTAEDTIGTRTYSIISGAQQFTDNNIRFDPNGFFYGRVTAPVGTVFSNIRIRVVDSDGPAYAKEFGPFDMKVVEQRPPVSTDGTFNRNFTWVEDKAFSGLTMPLFTNYDGLLTYTLGADAPDGLSIVDGELKGVIADPTEANKPLEFSYSVIDIYDRPATGTIKLTILPKMTLKAPDVTKVHRGNKSALPVTVTNGLAPYSYSLSPNSNLPDGMTLNTLTGTIEGTPTVEGSFPVVVIVTDKTGTEANSGEFNIFVDKPLPFAVNYTESTLTLNVEGTLSPTVTGADVDAVTWKHTSGTLPTGVVFIPEGSFAGSFSGIPTETGIFQNIQVTATNSITGIDTPATLTITVLPDRGLSLDSTIIKQRASTSSYTTNLKSNNAIGDVTYTFDSANPFPGQVVLTNKGALTYSFSEPGLYSGISIKATDAAIQETTATFGFEMVGDPTISAESVTLRQYETLDLPLDTKNIIGTATYSLAEGSTPLPPSITIDQTSGRLIGSPTEAAVLDNVIIKVTDSHDQKSEETEPFSITIEERLPLIAEATTINAKQFAPISGSITYKQNIGGVSFQITPQLPDELIFYPSTGAYSGTFERPYSGSFTVTATDSKGGDKGTSTTTLSINIEERDQLTLSTPESGIPALKQHQDIQAGTKLFDVKNALAPVNLTITPAFPPELTVAADGTISGRPVTKRDAATYTIVATDGLGGTRGQATYTVTLSITERDALVLSGPEDFSFNQYFPGYFDLEQANAIDGHDYSAVDALPGELALDSKTGRVSGVMTSKMASTPFTFRVTDGVGDSDDFTVRISVGDRLAPVIKTEANQPAILGAKFNKTLETENLLGEAVWAHVDGTLPPGIIFDATTGAFTGIPTEFGTFPGIKISLKDNYEGVLTNAPDRTFTINVMQDGSPIVLHAPTQTAARVNQAYSLPALTYENTVGDISWSATGLDGTGLVFNPDTGTISGTATVVGPINVSIKIEDPTDRDAVQEFTITVMPKITLSVTKEAELLFNYTTDDVQLVQPAAINPYSPVTWSIEGAHNLPDGVVFNTTNGRFEGTPREIGAFGPVTLSVSDSLPGSTTSDPIWFTVYMNEDPMTLAVTNYIGKVGYPISTALPVVTNNLGATRFYSLELGNLPIAVAPDTGIVTGMFSTPQDITFNLSATDTTYRVISQPIRIQILPKMTVAVAAQTIIPAQETMTPLKVSRFNAVGEATWDAIDPSLLPEGIDFNTDLGQFEGVAQLIGDYGPITVTSRDSLGDVATSNSLMLKVQAGSTYLNLLAGPLADAEKRTAYSFDFKQYIDPKTVGMDSSEIRWSLGGTTPPGLEINSETGVLSGTPSLSGTYTFDVVGSYKGKERTRRSYTLNVTLPEIDIDFRPGTLPVANMALQGRDYSVSFNFKDLVDFTGFPLEDVTYYIEPAAADEAFPQGLKITNGVLNGTATGPEGTYKFRLTAAFQNATDEHVWSTQTFTIKVENALNFKFKPIEEQSLPLAYKRAPYSFVFDNLIADDIRGITKSELTWSIRYLTGDGQSTLDSLPPYINNTTTNNILQGTMNYSGYRNLEITAAYLDRKITQTYRFEVALPEIGITLVSNENAIPPMQLRQDGGNFFDMKTLVTEAKNIDLANISFTASNDVTLQSNEKAGLPPGVSIGAGTAGTAAGWLRGSPAETGTFRFKLTANFKDNRQEAENLDVSREYVVSVQGFDMKFKEIVAGSTHACGIGTNNKTYCWGSGTYGRLGVGTTVTSYVPVEVTALSTNAVKLSTTSNSTCAITTTGEAYCWGYNNSGQLGDGTTTNQLTPTRITALATGVKDISVGTNHACALISDGTVKCWGDGAYGRLGDGTTNDTLTPVTAIGVADAKSIAVGANHSCAAKTNGTLMCWGYNNAGATSGDGTTSPLNRSPATVPGLTNVASVSLGHTSTCVLTTTGDTYCWGSNANGRIASGSTTSVLTPRKITELPQTTFLSEGHQHGCAVLVDGSAKCWGDNSYGQLGDNAITDKLSPVSVHNLTNLKYINAGYYGSCAIDNAGTGYCWGNSYIRGDGVSGSNSSVPVKVGG